MSAYGDYLITSGHYDITPEQEREIEAREKCERRGIDPDELCARLTSMTAARIAELERTLSLSEERVSEYHVRALQAEADRDEHLRLKNELVLKAYPAMDAVDRIKALIDAQPYENDVLTVAQIRAALNR